MIVLVMILANAFCAVSVSVNVLNSRLDSDLVFNFGFNNRFE